MQSFFAQIRMHKRMSPHGDYDHMGSSIDLVNNFNVEKVIFNVGSYNELENNLIKILKEKNINKNKLYFLNTDNI